MSKHNGNGHQPKVPETTDEGLLEAIASGDISAQELIDTLEKNPNLLERNPADLAMNKFKRMATKGVLPGAEAEEEEEEDAPGGMGCPISGRKKRPAPRGRGPMGRPPMESEEEEEEETSVIVPDTVLAMQSFESLVGEGCGLKKKKAKGKKKAKKKMKDASESRPAGQSPILEFAAPERQDVIRWARGHDPQRIGEGKTPFWFDGDDMISQNVVVARRDLEEQKAQVLHPKNVSAYIGRHAVLANQGLRYAGYDVEVVDQL